MKILLLVLFVGLLVCGIYLSCSMFPGEPVIPPDIGLSNPIFTKSELIEISTPENGSITTTTPSFGWSVTNQRLVFLGIFVENLDIQGNKITNKQANIWAWHSGLDTGREGSVLFMDGLDVVDGELASDSPPTPLLPGAYIWAVWAWDEDGIFISHSSEEIYFVVE